LSEGVDVPSLDGVAFIDPRKSQVDIVQAVGRVIRNSKSDGKTHGTIIIPVFIDDGENEQEALESSRFKPIWDVVNALKSHDDDLAQELDQLRISLGKRGVIGSGGLQKIVFELPKNCSQSFADGLRTRLVEQTTSSWMFSYGLLLEFVKQNDSARVPVTFKTKDGFNLGSWVGTQRRTKDSLSAERFRLLESCKGWSWDALADQWNENFEHLLEFVKKNGSARPESTFKTKDGFALGGWVSHQRTNKESLSVERRTLLESSCKDWTWDLLDDRWSEGFEQLMQYVNKNDSARVPTTLKNKDGFPLGQWVGVQRRNKDSLSTERFRLLESCRGWSWDISTAQWNEGFASLQEYVKKNGSARVLGDFKTKEGFNLGQWIRVQRSNKDSLSDERRKLLESCKGWSWDLLTDQWNENFEQLQAFARKTGSTKVGRHFTTKDGLKLGAWITQQRKQKPRLSVECRTLLDSLNGWSWDPLTDQWNEGFEHLQEFVKKTGSAKVRRHFTTKEGFKLGLWVSNQRKPMPAKRINLLESCKGWSWDALADQWNEGFEHLQEFVKKTGSARPMASLKTKDSYKLGSWVSEQRKHKSRLSIERIKLLESLKDWSWDISTDRWGEAFARLQDFATRTELARMRRTFKTKDGFNLGAWVGTQRYTKDSLSTESRKLLESLKGWSWDPLTDQWNEGFAQLQEYVKKNGSARVPRGFKTEDGLALGNWIGTQRRYKDSLSAERRNLLESLNGWTWGVIK